MEDVETADLLPCPFCGPSTLRVACWAGWFVKCECCGVKQGAQTKESAIAEWNRRAAAPAPLPGGLVSAEDVSWIDLVVRDEAPKYEGRAPEAAWDRLKAALLGSRPSPPVVPTEKAALLEVGGERPFVVTVIAEEPGKVGYRTGIVWAASEDEAVGRWMRFATEANPGSTLGTPAALHITPDNLDRARVRHGPEARIAAESLSVGRSEATAPNPSNGATDHEGAGE